uniref:Uncharacterized protein n=1 Tax=Romanomermis culicivorax TaxID=13658 RepID=A0A915HSI5_ROMCU
MPRLKYKHNRNPNFTDRNFIQNCPANTGRASAFIQSLFSEFKSPFYTVSLNRTDQILNQDFFTALNDRVIKNLENYKFHQIG